MKEIAFSTDRDASVINNRETMSQNKEGRTEERQMPDTVRTAGSESIRETDMGTLLNKPKVSEEVKKTVIKKEKKLPDTVRTAGHDDIMATDK
ncbi:MAG: hypothetical protein NZM05_02695 [Chloroherpetonaceae bacterium]|nr:hypothetical protein [Chloroherpetonaceae bacterium]